MRIRAAMVVALVLLAACGGDGPKGQLAERVGSSPAAGDTPAAAASGSPDAPAASGAKAAVTAKPASGTTYGGSQGSSGQKPVATAPAGTVTQPKEGQYVSTLSGEHTDPLPGARKESYPAGTQLRVRVTRSGDEFTAKSEVSGGQGTTQTTKTRWEAARVVLAYIELTSPFGTDSCTYAPPVEVLHIPIKVETLPRQAGSNGGCAWDVKVAYVKTEEASKVAACKDLAADLKGLKVWQVDNQTHFKFGQAEGDATGASWFSPDLGVPVCADITTTGTFGGQPFSRHEVTALQQRP